MILKEHTRNQKRMYRIHKMEEQIQKDKYIIGSQQQQITQLTNNWNELKNYIQKGINNSKMFPTAEMAYQLILDKLIELDGENEQIKINN